MGALWLWLRSSAACTGAWWVEAGDARDVRHEPLASKRANNIIKYNWR